MLDGTGCELGRVATEVRELLAPWAGCWRLWVSVAFLKGYLDALAACRA